ncbi:MAG: endonuclease/exonuclease/phosphatase family protein [Chloroflexota bacterium]|nr:endonuclease/exonuclease/phosphatase family protein [Chloroflexota bacterium]MDE2910832.1 endonuclease/exonuclease/phosphatase family protein [Chloroflexota bacterium]
MRILNWNTEFVSPRAKSDKFERIRATIAAYDADIICLTEAYPEALPDGGYLIKSNESGRVRAEAGGARKVILWSRNDWSDVDVIGSPEMPVGRFVSAKTKGAQGIEWTFVGMCVPYFGYRVNKKTWGDEAMRPWQGAEIYLDCLASVVLPQNRFGKRAILLGDYNMHIPPGNSSRQTKAVSQKCAAAFAGWEMPTAGEINDPALDKRFIDHVALTNDIELRSIRFISRFARDGTRLSDHNGVCLDVAPL